MFRWPFFKSSKQSKNENPQDIKLHALPPLCEADFAQKCYL